MHDPRVGRFFAIDPLAPHFPHNSPYAFAENRVISGTELEGLEYLDHNEARIKMTYGAAMINLDNINAPSYNMLHTNVYNENGTYQYRYPNQDLIYLGRYIYQGTVVNADLKISLEPKGFKRGFESGGLLEEDDIIAGEDTKIKHANKYNKKREITTASNYSFNKKANLKVAAVAAFTVALEQYTNYLVTEDYNELTRHQDILINKVLPAIKKALSDSKKTYIPESMRNVESLSLIVNVVLFGGDGSKKYTKEILETGMRIYYDLTKQGQKEKKLLDELAKTKDNKKTMTKTKG